MRWFAVDKISGKKIGTEKLVGPLNEIEKKFAPSHLFFRGDSRIFLDGAPRVSIIGTRTPSVTGIKNATILTKNLVEKGVVIVSGLARGIDTIAHQTTIKAGGRTVAVLGTPLSICYPSENRQLQNTIMEKHIVISQFAEGKPIQKANFPMRNRTMALLSHASIIIEAGQKSGTMHQGWEALRLGRPLFLFKELLENKSLKWPRKLVEYGAEVISVDDVENVQEVLPEGLISNVAF
jgi:DNA processing protein